MQVRIGARVVVWAEVRDRVRDRVKVGLGLGLARAAPSALLDQG